MTDIAVLPPRDRLGPLWHFVFELPDLVDRTSEKGSVLTNVSKLLTN